MFELLKVRRGKHRTWASFRKAIETVLKKDEIDNLGKALQIYREQIDTHILVFLRLGRAVFSNP